MWNYCYYILNNTMVSIISFLKCSNSYILVLFPTFSQFLPSLFSSTSLFYVFTSSLPFRSSSSHSPSLSLSVPLRSIVSLSLGPLTVFFYSRTWCAWPWGALLHVVVHDGRRSSSRTIGWCQEWRKLFPSIPCNLEELSDRESCLT